MKRPGTSHLPLSLSATLPVAATLLLIVPCAPLRAGHPRKVPPAATAPAVRPTCSRPTDPRRRPLRVAVFDVDVVKDVEVQGAALTDQINLFLGGMPKVTIVNRDQIERVAEEHKIALSGMVDTASAARLGKLLSAEYIIAGRASRIGQTCYLVLKIVDVETTVQTTVSGKAAVEDGFATVLERLSPALCLAIQGLQKPDTSPDDPALPELRRIASPHLGRTVLVVVDEQHVDRPLKDPAAQMSIVQRLRSLGISAVVPTEPAAGWKTHLLRTGEYDEQKVDVLLEGEGISAFAARLHGLVSCRARVELRWIPVPGRAVKASHRGVAAAADLVEVLAAKTALEQAGVQAIDAVIRDVGRRGRK